ncbi:hypothetical protein APHAL10511_001552 [Amanita phalloides]|nr:hypothetical protein APHAL10511_001552 [Amanita phalloides]
MIFGLFSRNSRQSLEQPQPEPSARPDNANESATPQLPLQVPPESPSPLPPPHVSDSSALYSLIRSVPPQVYHTYSLDRLRSTNREPPSPAILTAMTSFFSTLAPPPKLHCVRCHKSYFEVENTDRSCLVAHDDDSAQVARVSLSKAKDLGLASEYETLWGCCGRTVEGDGDMGPPDGWCYEGKHTTDMKRARFRADSTLNDDKLIPCSRLRCPGTLLSPTPSSVTRSARPAPKRIRPEDETDAEDPLSQTDAENERSVKRRRRTKSTASRRKSGEGAASTELEGDSKQEKMDVDSPQPKTKRARKLRTSTMDGNDSSTSSPSSRALRSKRQKPPPSTSEKPVSTTKSSVTLTKAEFESLSIKPKSSQGSLKGHGPGSTTSSLTDLASIKSSSPGRTRMTQRMAYVEVPRRSFGRMTPSQKTVVDTSSQSQSQDHVRTRAKTLAEVVETSVDAERMQ